MTAFLSIPGGPQLAGTAVFAVPKSLLVVPCPSGMHPLPEQSLPPALHMPSLASLLVGQLRYWLVCICVSC